LKKWNQIPDDTDILVTHGPPVGYGDLCYSGVRAGCVELLTTVQQRVKPKYHIFGHIHEGEFYHDNLLIILGLHRQITDIMKQNLSIFVVAFSNF
jgi:hypothetical protein